MIMANECPYFKGVEEVRGNGKCVRCQTERNTFLLPITFDKPCTNAERHLYDCRCYLYTQLKDAGAIDKTRIEGYSDEELKKMYLKLNNLEEKKMSEGITTVDFKEVPDTKSEKSIEMLELEINTLTNQARQMALSYIIEIGRRLKEAKSKVAHGEWSDWLEQKVNYSQSTAINYMRIAEEYGDQQINMFFNPNSQAFANLGYTKLIALLAVPADERSDFAESVDVENISTRELEKKIEELKAEKQKADDDFTKWEADDIKRKNELITESYKAIANAKNLENEITNLNYDIEELKNKKNKSDDAVLAEMQTIAAEKAVKTMNTQLESLNKKLEKATQDNVKLQTEIEETNAKANDQDAIDEAVEKAKEELDSKIWQLKNEKAESEEKLILLEKKLSLSGNTSLLRFDMYFQQVQKDFAELEKAMQLIKQDDEEKYNKLLPAVKKVVTDSLDRL